MRPRYAHVGGPDIIGVGRMGRFGRFYFLSMNPIESIVGFLLSERDAN